MSSPASTHTPAPQAAAGATPSTAGCVRDVKWTQVRQPLFLGDEAAVAAMRGRIDWSSVKDSGYELGANVPWSVDSFRLTARAAAITLLQIALEEFDAGGKRLFQIDEFDVIKNWIKSDFPEALGIFLQAGGDLQGSCDGENPADFARDQGKPQIEAMLRAYMARQEAERVLQEGYGTPRGSMAP